MKNKTKLISMWLVRVVREIESGQFRGMHHPDIPVWFL